MEIETIICTPSWGQPLAALLWESVSLWALVPILGTGAGETQLCSLDPLYIHGKSLLFMESLASC